MVGCRPRSGPLDLRRAFLPLSPRAGERPTESPAALLRGRARPPHARGGGGAVVARRARVQMQGAPRRLQSSAYRCNTATTPRLKSSAQVVSPAEARKTSSWSPPPPLELDPLAGPAYVAAGLGRPGRGVVASRRLRRGAGARPPPPAGAPRRRRASNICLGRRPLVHLMDEGPANNRKRARRGVSSSRQPRASLSACSALSAGRVILPTSAGRSHSPPAPRRSPLRSPPGPAAGKGRRSSASVVQQARPPLRAQPDPPTRRGTQAARALCV